MWGSDLSHRLSTLVSWMLGLGLAGWWGLRSRELCPAGEPRHCNRPSASGQGPHSGSSSPSVSGEMDRLTSTDWLAERTRRLTRWALKYKHVTRRKKSQMAQITQARQEPGRSKTCCKFFSVWWVVDLTWHQTTLGRYVMPAYMICMKIKRQTPKNEIETKHGQSASQFESF